MNKTAIIYASIHHKNTEKLLTGISKEIEIDIINISQNSDAFALPFR